MFTLRTAGLCLPRKASYMAGKVIVRTMVPTCLTLNCQSSATTAFFKQGMESGLGSLALKTEEVGPTGETLYERGTFSFHGKDGSVIEEGK